ncbi:hypothetical protein LSTR_LSTR008483 [Laodelphax striatellus]|uniref:Uncharacterized protein n=1 Tax=Laodelphax striatellus TaxID=195883 RepID=A0A482X2W9_LAOST|nr:hypothetical protein LSTR_LSTR008483 [Laodelphax striatellus]
MDQVARTHDSNNSSRSPKLGPSIVEKPFNVEKDLAFIWEVLNRTIDGHEKLDKYQPAIIELLTNRTLNQRNQVAEAYKEKINNLLTWPKDLNSAFGGEIGSLFTEVKVLLHSYVQESLDLSRDWAYMSIICTSSANRIKDLNSVSFVDAKKKNDPNDPLHLKDPSLGEYIDKQLNQKGGRVVLNSILNNQRPEGGIDPAKIPDQDYDWDRSHDLFQYIIYRLCKGNTGHTTLKNQIHSIEWSVAEGDKRLSDNPEVPRSNTVPTVRHTGTDFDRNGHFSSSGGDEKTSARLPKISHHLSSSPLIHYPRTNLELMWASP